MPELTQERLELLQSAAVGYGSYIDGNLQEQMYLVIARSFEPRWRGFIFQLSDGSMAISEDVPVDYRASIVKEVSEIGFYESRQKLNLQSVVEEGPFNLEPVLGPIGLRRFVRYRYGFTKRLIAYGKAEGWDVSRFEDSLDHIKPPG